MAGNYEDNLMDSNSRVSDEDLGRRKIAGTKDDPLHLRQFNIVIPQVLYTQIRQLAAAYGLSLYTVTRTVMFLGVASFERTMQNPEMAPKLLNYFEKHRSLKQDRNKNVEKQNE